MLHMLYTTLPDTENARTLARALVEQKLVACVNVMPAHTAIYAWEGALYEETETALWCKTPEAQLSAAMAMIRSQHPYETPCILAWPVSLCDAAYAHWATQVTSGV